VVGDRQDERHVQDHGHPVGRRESVARGALSGYPVVVAS
jgi:hypothetical protein